MSIHVLERSQIINRSKSETFAFYCDAFNLEQITPKFLKFRIITPAPINMQPGTLIDYQLSLFGVPFQWQTLIDTWVPGERFVDMQVKGPYKLWRHTHTFESLGPQQTLVRDRVEYELPMGPLGNIAHTLWVRRTLGTIFDYRARMTEQLLNDERPRVIAA